MCAHTLVGPAQGLPQGLEQISRKLTLESEGREGANIGLFVNYHTYFTKVHVLCKVSYACHHL